ncbi:MAG TPA: Npt1/Npt2 family nucleotide transporter [Candidatus Babeliales bacterium]|nr:Npt1/Npt2 family nucleotide transporter [Candidatus Babeliales bacterium]
MLTKIARWWWGDFQEGELKKFGLLSLIFGLVIGVYWFLRPLKDSIFQAVVGVDYIPRAKMLSLVVVFPLVLIYSKLVDMFPRQQMFYALCTIYGVLAIVFAFLMNHSTVGLSAGARPDNLWGWAWYVYVESFGSLIVALFWAFTADTTQPDSAERGYPVVAFGGQLGNIFGPLALYFIMHNFAHFEMTPEGELPVGAAAHSALIHSGAVAGAAIVMGLIMLLVKIFMTSIPKEQLVGYHGKGEKKHDSEPGFFEGLRLIFSSGYLLAIFAIISFYEVIVTVLDFNFKTLATAQFPVQHELTKYLAAYGSWVGVVSMLSIALGINKIQRVLGLGASLALLPILVAVAVLTFKAYPIVSVLFWIMVFSKAVNYALNQPSMKQLYIPTTKDAKYKSQAFIEMYGSRGSKALGSSVNLWRKTFIEKYGAIAGLDQFIMMCTFASLGIIAFWIPITIYLGRTFKKAVDAKSVVV